MKASSLLYVLLCLLLATVAACLFLPGLTGGFLFDDTANIIENRALHLTRLTADGLLYAAYSFQPGQGSRALTMLSFALDHWRGGLDAQVFKGTNLLIHLLTTWVLALFFRRLLQTAAWPAREATVGALAMALLWAIHPLQVSSVLYVVQRMQTLSTLFLVLALWGYLAMRLAQIEGRRSRVFGMLTLLGGALAFASKEDAILLPAYALLMELTLLRFRASDAALGERLHKVFLVFALAGVAAYLLVAVPHFWRWEAYPGRDFSSYERLLTQARVLVMYLGQILLPLPGQMPFYYDNLTVSRGLLKPATTLPSLTMIAGLLMLAWWMRHRRPLFAFGVLLFFTGHFVTSNVIGLELAFEHRNHLPLIGAVLAFGDLFAAAWRRSGTSPRWAIAGVAVILALAGSATWARAHIWGDPLRLATYSVASSPDSARAWVALVSVYADRSELKADSPWLDKAIDASARGAARTHGPSLLSNVVTFKTIKGTVSQDDWERLLLQLRRAPMNPQTRNILWVVLNNVDSGIPMDERGVIEVIEVISSRSSLPPEWDLRIASYLHNRSHQPSKALPYLRRFVERTPPDNPAIDKLLAQLFAVGREDWAMELMAIRQARQR